MHVGFCTGAGVALTKQLHLTCLQATLELLQLELQLWAMQSKITMHISLSSLPQASFVYPKHPVFTAPKITAVDQSICIAREK